MNLPAQVAEAACPQARRVLRNAAQRRLDAGFSPLEWAFMN